MTSGGSHGPGAASTADGSLSSVEAYQSAILAAIAPLAPSSLELAAAEGCVLAEDVTAAVALPSFDNSSMDGYAVLAADVAGASQESPATLRVTGEIAAGDTGIYRLVPGTAIKIMTGAQLPAGADAVVPVEWTDDGIAQVRVYQPPSQVTRSGTPAGTPPRARRCSARERGCAPCRSPSRRPPGARRSPSARGPGWSCCPPGTS